MDLLVSRLRQPRVDTVAKRSGSVLPGGGHNKLLSLSLRVTGSAHSPSTVTISHAKVKIDRFIELVHRLERPPPFYHAHAPDALPATSRGVADAPDLSLIHI